MVFQGDNNLEEIRFVIADDCDVSRNLLKKIIHAFPIYKCVGEASNGDELISQVLIEKPHIIFVDITMPKVNGIDAAKDCMSLYPNLIVIFITGHNNYALDAFNMAAFDYIMKPINRIRLISSLEKARQAINHSNKLKNAYPQRQGEKKLVCRREGTIYYLSLQDIIFIEKEGRKAVIHTRKKIVETNETINSLLVRLDSRFIQSHRSYIININYISEMNQIGDSYIVSFNDYSGKAYISRKNFNRVTSYIEKEVSFELKNHLVNNS